jgi:hypothetical protein
MGAPRRSHPQGLGLAVLPLAAVPLQALGALPTRQRQQQAALVRCWQ